MVRTLAATLIGLILSSTVQSREALQHRYRRLPTKQIAAELNRYSPPRPLFDEAARRGLSYSLSLQHRDRATLCSGL